MPVTLLTPKAVSILLGNFIKGNQDECWLWFGRTYDNEYGRIEYMKERITYASLAHRISYMYHNKIQELDRNILVCHTCDNRICVNPNHMFLGTDQTNVDDMIAKGRNSRGINHPNSKLTEDDVRDIRIKHELLGWSTYLLARHYKVSQRLIFSVVKYIHWKHIKD